MPTQAEYSARLRPLLSQSLHPHLGAAARAEEFSMDTLADRLGGLLAELERQHYGASAHLRGLMASESVEPWGGDGEVAFLLYYLHNPPDALRKEIDAFPPLKEVWDAMAKVAAKPAFTPGEFEKLGSWLAKGLEVACDLWGEVYGTGKYEVLDAGWAWTLKNDLMNHLPRWLGHGCGVADFARRDWTQPVQLQPGSDGQVRIAILGDWGCGSYTLDGLANPNGPALAVMDTLASLPVKPDYLIHLGDTYYAGTGANRSPSDEEAAGLVNVLAQYPALARPGRCFTLNSNHEMYGGAWGYYDTALAHPLFGAQQGCSYFALEFGDWIIAAIDSAYFDPSRLYLDGGLGGRDENPQFSFLEQLRARSKKVILMSHHTGLSTDGTAPAPLWHDVTSVVQPDYWYWGHVHLGAVYSGSAYSKNMKTRCIGHSGIPLAVAPGMEQCAPNVDWYSNTPLAAQRGLGALWYSRPRARNGFAMLTLSRHGITEEIYDIGNATPVWKG